MTHGVYSHFRHPAYTGWFYWCIGTQILLANPICLVAYTIVTFRFFLERIPHEERLLEHFFGDEYRMYRERSWLGIPCMDGLIRKRIASY